MSGSYPEHSFEASQDDPARCGATLRPATTSQPGLRCLFRPGNRAVHAPGALPAPRLTVVSEPDDDDPLWVLTDKGRRVLDARRPL